MRKHTTALGRIYWPNYGARSKHGSFWLEVDPRYFETRPQGCYVARLPDGRVYLRSSNGFTEALIIDYNRRYLNRVELTLLELSQVSAIHWIEVDNTVSVFLKPKPINNPEAYLRSSGRRITRALRRIPHQVAVRARDVYTHGSTLWVSNQNGYHCQPGKPLAGPEGYAVEISCRGNSPDGDAWSSSGTNQIRICDTVRLVEYRVTETGVWSRRPFIRTDTFTTGPSPEWEPVRDAGEFRRMMVIWKTVKERAKGDTGYWFNELTRATYGYSDECQQALADAEAFLARQLSS